MGGDGRWRRRREEWLYVLEGDLGGEWGILLWAEIVGGHMDSFLCALHVFFLGVWMDVSL